MTERVFKCFCYKEMMDVWSEGHASYPGLITTQYVHSLHRTSQVRIYILLNKNEIKQRAVGMTQWVRSLLCNHGDPSSSPQCSHNSFMSIIPALGWCRQAHPEGFLETLSQKQGSDKKDSEHWLLASTSVYAGGHSCTPPHTHLHTHIHICKPHIHAHISYIHAHVHIHWHTHRHTHPIQRVL